MKLTKEERKNRDKEIKKIVKARDWWRDKFEGYSKSKSS